MRNFKFLGIIRQFLHFPKFLMLLSRHFLCAKPMSSPRGGMPILGCRPPPKTVWASRAKGAHASQKLPLG